MIRLRVLLILYRELYPFTAGTSLLMWLASGHPTLSLDRFLVFAVRFFWLRLLSQAAIWYLFRTTNRKGFIFYHHFGLSEIQLALWVYVIDLFIFSLWIIGISQVL